MPRYKRSSLVNMLIKSMKWGKTRDDAFLHWELHVTAQNKANIEHSHVERWMKHVFSVEFILRQKWRYRNGQSNEIASMKQQTNTFWWWISQISVESSTGNVETYRGGFRLQGLSDAFCLFLELRFDRWRNEGEFKGERHEASFGYNRNSV